MKIYTRTGDDGSTGLYGGGRVSKADPRIAAFGSVDELNAALGLVSIQQLDGELSQMVVAIQNRLFEIGAELSSLDPTAAGTATLGAADIEAIEGWIDQLDSSLPPLSTFILPGGTTAAAYLHFARCICRRAERLVVEIAENSEIRDVVIRYLNRVGDLLFVMARTANDRAGVADVPWEKRR